MTKTIRLNPGAVPLCQWRDIYFGADAGLETSCRPMVEAAAATVSAIIAKGVPVYGINTGFGKLASVRIDADNLEILQRNIVLSHAAGVGEPLPVSVVRLVVALKLASLAQGASGVRWEIIEHLGACLGAGLTPVIPGQGSAGASGDLAPLAHMTAALMGVGEFFLEGMRVPADAALARARRESAGARTKRRPRASQWHADLNCAGARGPVPSGAHLSGSTCHRRALNRCGEGLRRAVRQSYPGAAPASWPNRGGGRSARADSRQRDQGVAPCQR